MKYFKKRYLLLIPVILIVSVILFIRIDNRTLSRNTADISEIIYIPDGTADNYMNLYSGFTDGHIIWEYKLNKKEKKYIENDLSNGIWKKYTTRDMSEIEYYFTFNSESYLPDNISDNLYFCIYDYGLDKFIGIEDDVAVFGWDRALFVYDRENAQYHCVSLSI